MEGQVPLLKLTGIIVMNNAAQHILMQLEIILREYPEAEFYIQERMRSIISDLLNSEICLEELEQKKV
jgi:hypothetical protein